MILPHITPHIGIFRRKCPIHLIAGITKIIFTPLRADTGMSGEW